jgi:hypothetical protein
MTADETDRRVVSLGTNGRHRRRGLLRRAAPAAATTAGTVALATTIGTAAFWLVPGDQRVPFGGFGPGSTGAARPTSELTTATGGATSKPRGSSDTTVGQPGTMAGSAAALAVRSRQIAASRSTSRAPATSRTPRPSKTKTTGRPTDKPSLPHTTPPPLATVTPPPVLPVSITATVSAPDLP